GRMVPNHLLGSHFRRFVKGNGLLTPGSFYHSGLGILFVPQSSRHHISYAVNEPGLERTALRQLQPDGLFRHKFRLGGHNGPARSRLGHFIPCPLFQAFLLNPGKKGLLHKPFDKGTFTCPYRSHYPQVDVSPGPLGDLPVNLFRRHGLASLLHSSRWGTSSLTGLCISSSSRRLHAIHCSVAPPQGSDNWYTL